MLRGCSGSPRHWHFATSVWMRVRVRSISATSILQLYKWAGLIQNSYHFVVCSNGHAIIALEPAEWHRGGDRSTLYIYKILLMWTLDQLNHLCILSSSASTAYPSSSTGGYVLRADPASLCQEKLQNRHLWCAGQRHATWCDVRIAKPSRVQQNASDFPRHW